ncbi:MAG: DNA translocase FtsK 4TM domain-containing protein [bacterium]
MRGRKKSAFKKIIEDIRGINEGTKKGIWIIFIFVLGGLSFLSLFGMAGNIGLHINGWLSNIFGSARIIFPTALLILCHLLLYPDKYEIKKPNYFGILLLFISIPGIIHLVKIFYYSYFLEEILPLQKGGGYIGNLTKYPINLMGMTAAVLIFLALFFIGCLLTFNTSILEMRKKMALALWPVKKIKEFIGWWKWRRKDLGQELNQRIESDDLQETKVADKEEIKKLEIRNLKLDEQGNEVKDLTEDDHNIEHMQQELIPKRLYNKIDIPLELLENQQGKPTSVDIKNNTEVIRKTLENFGIDVEMGDVNVGPTVTQFTLRPSEGIKLSQITTLHNDLALALAAHPIRIEAPIPGKALVGVEVPNQKIAVVGLKEILQASEFRTRKSNLLLALGKDVSGKPWLADLARMPHLLIAGSTGSGKTICINAIIMSLLYQNTPETLKLILVDPKRVELPVYNGINYLITPVITDVKKTVNALKWAVSEMERRFEVLSSAHSRDIESYNSSAEEKLPYIVIVIDELADLMSSSGAEVEGAIIRLAQMARAVGIHLILATQRPSVNVITGLIKANIPARIAFSVASLIDSRTILDNSGAEKLLGRGDMLFMSAEVSKPKRIQGAFVSEQETKRVARYIKDNSGDAPAYDENVVENKHKAAGGGAGDDEADEELLEEAKEIILNAGRASTSLLQRRLKIGYSRAARIIDILEEQGVVGPAEGSKPREVINQ